jgi:hypothetical protein
MQWFNCTCKRTHTTYSLIGRQVFMVVITMSTIFWNVTPRGLVYITAAWVVLSPEMATNFYHITRHHIPHYRTVPYNSYAMKTFFFQSLPPF